MWYLILAMVMLFPQLAYGNNIKWLPANVTVSSGTSSNCKIAADGDFVVLVWEDNRNDYTKKDIYCNFSTDGGQTWQATDRRLNTSAPGSSISIFPDVAVSGSRVYVAWQDNRNGKPDIYFNYSTNYGHTWLGTDVRINLGSAAGDKHCWPPKVYASGDYVYVGWSETRFGYAVGIFLNYSVNGGQNWQATDVQIDDGGLDCTGWKFFVNGNKIYCVWWCYYGVFFDRSLNNGAGWLVADHRVNVSDSGNSKYPDIAVEGSNIYVFWFRENSANQAGINYNHSEDGGLTWDVSDSSISWGSWPYVGMSNGVISLVSKMHDFWLDMDFISYRQYDTELDVWTDAVVVRGYDAKDCDDPAMAVSGKLVFFAWQDVVCLDASVRYNYSLNGGKSFSFASDTPMFLNDNACSGANASDPVIAVSGNTVYVAWVDYASVFFTRGDIRRVLPFLNLLIN